MADVIPDKIQPPESVRSASDNLARKRVLTEVAGQRDRLATGLGDLLRHGVGARLVKINDADGGALLGEAQRAGPAHAGGSRGDEADLVGKAHAIFPSCYVRPIGESDSRRGPPTRRHSPSKFCAADG